MATPQEQSAPAYYLAGGKQAHEAGEFLTDPQLADLLHVDRRTTKRWRANGEGPPFIRLGRQRVIYARYDVDQWLAERRFTHRAAEAASQQAAA
jgi:predicted DNA-binding transcriptional regulator AlpA